MGLFRALNATPAPAPTAVTTPPSGFSDGEQCGRCKGTGSAAWRSTAARNTRAHDKLVNGGMDSGAAWHKVLADAPKPKSCAACGGTGRKKKRRGT